MGTGASRFAHKSTCNLQCMPWTPVRHSSGNAAATRPSYSYRVRRCGTPSIVAQNCSLSTMVGDKTANRWPWWIAAFLLYTQHHCPPTKTRQIHPRIIIVVRYTLRGSRVDYRFFSPVHSVRERWFLPINKEENLILRPGFSLPSLISTITINVSFPYPTREGEKRRVLWAFIWILFMHARSPARAFHFFFRGENFSSFHSLLR